ncbi:hypothetical protein NP493_1414g01020 [Ridgeia piscesae]|uniref:Uncharacterized protein n=1 Tax=Ridgeia piscesae TaxID=27915 RepID=A0AAD9K479_RIDPI|nr:hypothetical protein NP493_1414g01020 [Ridgeia piscesae]
MTTYSLRDRVEVGTLNRPSGLYDSVEQLLYHGISLHKISLANFSSQTFHVSDHYRHWHMALPVCITFQQCRPLKSLAQLHDMRSSVKTLSMPRLTLHIVMGNFR